MNHTLKINGDREVLKHLDNLVDHGYLSESEKLDCISRNCVSSELLEIVNNRIEVYNATFKNYKYEQLMIFCRTFKRESLN